MPWELQKVEDTRLKLIQEYLDGASMTDLCKRYNISRKTAYKWFNRYEESGQSGLQDLPRVPHNLVYKYSKKDIELAIKLKLQKRGWGPKKILAKLAKDFPDHEWPSPTWLYEIFKEHYLVTSRKFRRRVPATHPLEDVNASNDVWMADFKGWFLAKNGEKCEPLTITDGHSRYLLCCRHLFKKSTDYVWPVFEEAFKEYGLPNRIRTDNGPPFGCLGVGRMTKLSINFIKAGVIPEWINPGHPEENGRHERFHLTLKQAIANPPARNLSEQLSRMKTFQDEYNYERPHEALDFATPAEHYQASRRKWDGILRQPEYDTREMVVRKICASGCIWLNQNEYFIGQTLTGEYIGIKEQKDGELGVYYGSVYLGNLRIGEGLERPKLKPKKIIRRG